MAEHDATSVMNETANDRFKNQSGNWLWMSVVAATVVHFALFAFWPDMTAADYEWTPEAFEAIELPDEIEIPPPPEQIARPATPVVSDAVIDEDITIASTTFEDNPIEMMQAPTTSASDDVSAAPTFTPMTVAPQLENQPEVQRALTRNYPPILRDAGIGGRATVWFFIDENGRVVKTQLNESSGYEQLDQAAMQVAEVMQFSPAWNRDKKVQVWVSIPIAFESR